MSTVHDDGLVAHADTQPAVGMTLEKVGTLDAETLGAAMSYGTFALPLPLSSVGIVLVVGCGSGSKPD